ncbi:hypothetical protein ACQ4WX_20280 [Streptomyces lasalocidi]
MAKGGEVRLTLEGTKSRPWKPVQASGTALKAINTGFLIRPGQATAAYHAVAAKHREADLVPPDVRAAHEARRSVVHGHPGMGGHGDREVGDPVT